MQERPARRSGRHLHIVGAVMAALFAARLAAYAALAPDGLAQGLCQWDCNWYLSIAGAGYDLAPHSVGGRLQANWAFFPLFPALIWLVNAATGIPPVISGIALSTVALWGFAVFGWLYRARTRPDASPWPWLLLLAAWPYGFYFNAPYTESLYAALAAGGLLALRAERPWLAAAACALLGATRPTGVLLGGWLGLDRLWRARTARSPSAALRLLMPIALAPLGLAGFMALLWWRVGDPLAFAHIQDAWGHTPGNPLLVLLDALRSADPGHGHVGLLYNAGWALLGFAAAGFLVARGHAAEAWLCATTVLMALLSGMVWSMPRYVACSPALLFAAADVLEWLPRGGRAAALLALAAVQMVFLLGWFRGAAFLM